MHARLREDEREAGPRLPAKPLCLGRESEIHGLVADLLHGSTSLSVTGPAGMGKATLLLAAVHHPRVEGRFGDRRFFVRCDAARSRDALLVDLGRGLGLEPWHDLEDRLIAELRKAPAVLALAGLDIPWQADPERTEALLARLSTVHDLTLVSTVSDDELPPGLPGRQFLRLGPLGQPAARDLFLTLAGSRFDDDPGLDPLLDLVDRVPLAVSVLARAARSQPDLAAVRGRWQSCRDQRAARLRWRGVQEWLLYVEVPLEVALTGPGITPDALRLLSLLADLPDGVRLEDLPLLLLKGDEAAPVLTDAGLAFEEHDRLRVLAPVREEVRREHPSREEDLDRAVALYLERGAAVGWIEEPGNIHSMLLLGLEGPDPEPAIRAALGLGDLVRSLGWGAGGLYELERAGEVARETGRDELAALCSALLGDLARARSDAETSCDHYEEALRRYRHAGEVRGEAHCLQRLGDAALERDDLDAARRQYEEALPVYRRLRDRLGEADCLRSLGDIAATRMEFGAALERYAEATALYRRVGNLQGEAHCLRAQGDLALISNDLAGAHGHYREALSLYRRVGDLLGQANCLQREGDLAAALSDACAARFRYEEALSLCEKIREPYSLGLVHVRLALLQAEGSIERRQHIQAARESWETIGRTELLEMLAEVSE